MRTIPALALLAVLAPLPMGCQETKPPPETAARPAATSQPTSAARWVEITPASKEFAGPTESYKREVKHWRWVTPFGQAPGATVSSVTPFKGKLASGDSTIDGDLVGGATGELAGGGAKPPGLIARLVRWLKRAAIVYVGLLAVAGVLTFIPATHAIGALGLRLLVGWIPMVGGICEAIIGARKKAAADQRADLERQRLAQTVRGVQAYRDGLETEPKAAMTAALRSEQDADTQDEVRKIKAGITG